MTPTAFAQRAADWLAHPSVMVGIVAASVASLLVFGANVTTFVLSVMAITISQLLLLAGAADTRAIKAMLQAQVRASPDIPDHIAEDHS